MEKKYVSVDIETSGRTPGKYSMLSLGSCIVGETSKQFYREIKPISMNYIMPAMKISVLGLKCINSYPYRYLSEFNPKSKLYNPEVVLEVLMEKGEEPRKVMNDYADWIISNTKEFKPTECASPIKFDGMFTTWYFDNFYHKENPLGYGGDDINSIYKGFTNNIYSHIIDLGLRKGDMSHNALEDAIIQAKDFEKILQMMKNKNKQ